MDSIRPNNFLLIKTTKMNIIPRGSSNLNLNIKSENQKIFSSSINQKLSFDNIRGFRQNFEQGSNPLIPILGEEKHQTMIVAMFEGTEKLLNKSVSEYDVLEYLEGLKIEARELSLKGISGEEFRNSLINHSISKVNDLLRSS